MCSGGCVFSGIPVKAEFLLLGVHGALDAEGHAICALFFAKQLGAFHFVLFEMTATESIA